MPFEDHDIHINLACGIREDGHWHGFFTIEIRTRHLRRLGLHPDQPWSQVRAPTPPGWWRAEALRRLFGGDRHKRRR